LNEGTPLTLIEAMNSGCAVVATEVGGVIDILGQRGEQRVEFSCWEHGITTSVRDVAAFANALQLLLTQPDLRRLMGERGRDFVRTNLSRERLLQDIATLYRELNS
jgi:glycosyltransferase involved in cell wall biosynthesis